MASWKKVITSGSDANLRNLVVSHSVVATSITGSLLGSATSAEIVVINSTTAPSGTLSGSLWFNTQDLTLYVKYQDPSGSSYWVPSFNAGIPLSSSYAESSSYVDSAQTASYVVTAQTASFVNTARTASFVSTAQTASYILNAVSASFATTANSAASSTRASTVSVSGINSNAEYAFPLIITASSGASIGLNNDTSPGFTYNPSTNLFKIFNIQATGSLLGTSSLAENALTASYVDTARTASKASTVDISLFGSDIDSYVVLSNVTGRSGVSVGAGNSLTYNANKDKLTVGKISANSLTGSLLGTATNADTAINADTASYVVTALTASYYNLPTTYSQAYTASFVNIALTASYVVTALTASFVATAQTASRITGSNVVGIVSEAYTASFISRLSQNVIITGSVETTAGITSTQLTLTDNGNSTNLKIGDDVWIGDINTANTFGIRGVYNTGSGFIRFGNALTSPLIGANNGSATVELTGSLAITGQIIQPTKVGFSVYGSGTTNNLSTTQNGDGTLNTNNFTIEFNQGSHLTGSSGIFTAPLPGLYQANLIARNSGYSSGISQIAIMKNNSGTGGNIAMMEFAASSTMNHTGVSKVFYMVAGDTLRIKVLAGQINFDSNDSWSVVYLG